MFTVRVRTEAPKCAQKNLYRWEEKGMKGLKFYKTFYYISVSVSFLVGLWHFFVPLMFQWYSYISDEYYNLIVGIDWTNLCFSFLLAGTSLILLFWGKKVFSNNIEAITIYTFLTVVWLFRFLIALIEPWPLNPVPAAAIGQFVATIVILIMIATPCIAVLVNYFKTKKENKK